MKNKTKNIINILIIIVGISFSIYLKIINENIYSIFSFILTIGFITHLRLNMLEDKIR